VPCVTVNETDANILAYDTPPQHAYRTRATSRTTQTKRTTRTQAKKKAKFSENTEEEETAARENDQPPVFNLLSQEISNKPDSAAPVVLLPGGISKGQPLVSHVFSPPIGKPGKGHVKDKVHAYEEYIEHHSPSSRQGLNQTSVPDTPEQKETLTSASESCLETPEATRSKRQSIRKSSKSNTALRKSLLKSSQISLNPATHNKEVML
jgi:hypothetical protein